MRRVLQSEFEDYLGIPHLSKDWACLSPHFDPEALQVNKIGRLEANMVTLAVRKRIEADTQRVGSDMRQDTWESGWNDNLSLYLQSSDWFALQPRYYTSAKALRSPVTNFPVFRVGGEFVTSTRVDFEIHMAEAYRSLIFHHLSSRLDPSLVVELGSGSGLNLLALARVFPGAGLLAADYVQSALACAKLLGEKNSIALESMTFDFHDPPSVGFPENSLVVTMGALEQIGSGKTAQMLSWILRQRGVWFFHSEPFAEMYTATSEMDALLKEFVSRRGYTQGVLPALRAAARAGHISNFCERRVPVGSALLEGYNWVLYQVAH